MPLPLSYDCSDCVEVCCDTLFVLADRLRIVAADAVNACLPVDVCGEIDSFVAVGFEAEDPIGDSISVTVVNVQDAVDSTTNEQAGPLALVRADLVLRLLESGYPMLLSTDGENILAPDRAEVHLASKHSMAHAEAMLRAIRNGLRRPAIPMFRPFVPPGTIFGVVPQPMRPIPPQMGLVGWTLTLGVRVALGNLNPS